MSCHALLLNPSSVFLIIYSSASWMRSSIWSENLYCASFSTLLNGCKVNIAWCAHTHLIPQIKKPFENAIESPALQPSVISLLLWIPLFGTSKLPFPNQVSWTLTFFSSFLTIHPLCHTCNISSSPNWQCLDYFLNSSTNRSTVLPYYPSVYMLTCPEHT